MHAVSQVLNCMACLVDSRAMQQCGRSKLKVTQSEPPTVSAQFYLDFMGELQCCDTFLLVYR